MRKIEFKTMIQYLGQVLILSAIYLIAAWIGLSMGFMEKKVALLWPPSGIALAAILLYGYRLWPGIVLGVILANILIGAPPEFVFVTAIGNSLAAVFSVYLLRRWVQFHNALDRVKDVIGLVFIGAGVSSLINATMAAAGYYLGGTISESVLGSTWLRWFIGDALGVVVITPALLTWATPSPLPRNKNSLYMLEAAALTILVVIAGLGVYGGLFIHNTTYLISYIIFPLAIWSALRFGTRSVSAIILYWTGMAVWGTIKGLGPFDTPSLQENIFSLDCIIAMLIILLLLAAQLTERKKIESTLHESEERYRLLVEHSPEAIFVHTGNKIVYVNPAGIKLIGATGPEQLIGRPPLDFLHPDYTGQVLDQMQQLLVERKTVPLTEEKFIRFDNVPIDVEVASIPINYQGNPAIQMVVRDISKRKRAEEELRISEERFHSLSDAAEEGLAIHHEGTILEANEALSRLSGYSHNELIGLYGAKLTTPETWEIVKKHMAEGYTKPYEGTGVRKDGSTFWCQLVGKPYVYKGKTLRLTVFRDISEQKQAEEELRISEERFHSLSDAAEEGIAIHHEGTILEANEALARMSGYTHNELIGMHGEKLVTPETWEIIKKHMAEGYTKPFEGMGVRKDGSTIWLQMVGKPYVYKGKTLRLSVFRDISEQKQAEEAVRISESKYRRLFETARDGILILDADTCQIIEFNPTLEKMLKYPKDLIIGKNFWEISCFKDLEISETVYNELQDKGYIHYEHLHLENNDGCHLDVEFACISYQDNHQKMIQCNIRDITTRKKAEAKIRQAQIAISKANQMKDDFLTSISHEIRTPMNSILGFAQLLDEMIIEKQRIDRKKRITEERRLEDNVRENLQREYINAIKSCGEVLINLLNDILDFKKIEAGKLELQYEFFTPHSIFSDMKQIFMPKIKDKGLELIIKIDPSIPPAIFLDKLRLQQILFNLISNAIKFTIRGFIKLEVQKVGSDNPDTCDLEFSVQDTGIGISKDQLEIIFEAFKQKKGQDISLFGGTGLGLTISRHLVEMMNGVINVESEEEKGSIFKVLFKDVRKGVGLEIASVQAQEDLDTSKFDNITILIADDNETNRTLKKQFFRSSLARFIEAENGQNAIELAKKYKPDLIIMDLQMPIMNGSDAARIIKTDDELNEIPIIADIASGDIRDSHEILEMNFDGFLKNPYGRSQLIKELLRFLPRIVEKQLRNRTEIDSSKEVYKLGDIAPHVRAKLPELISILKNELTMPWNHIRDTFILDEIDMFAQRVLKLGEVYEITVFTDWGNDIKRLSESCEMEKLMATLDYFPVLIKQIEIYLRNKEGQNG